MGEQVHRPRFRGVGQPDLRLSFRGRGQQSCDEEQGSAELPTSDELKGSVWLLIGGREYVSVRPLT